MLVELVVRDLGVIAEARLAPADAMSALTGETGAGKTMLVEALHLLAGGRPDPARVRPGATEAVVEGFFVVGDTEWVLRREVPASGRSRSRLNGELCTSATLGEVAAGLLEIHGQHAHQALRSPRHQRDALDLFGGIDRRPLDEARRELRRLTAELEDSGGDERARSRQLELLRHQVAEITSVAPRVGEDAELALEQDVLAGALEHREAGEAAIELLSGDRGALDLLAAAADRLGDRRPFADQGARLTDVVAELRDCAAEVRSVAEVIEPDEERLAALGERRRALADLRRKYGEDESEVLAFADAVTRELEDLEGLEARRGELAEAITVARSQVATEASAVGQKRRGASVELGARVTATLGDLALAGAVLEVQVDDSEDLPGAGEQVSFLFAANPGAPAGPLERVASGGELSRVMLALRLVLSGGPPTMVFDEVDAGVGGAAAGAVGAALAELSGGHQVLVVTHLPQVAAHADAQFLVAKDQALTTVTALGEGERVVELSRMLSGSPDSDTARRHAAELLAAAPRRR